MECAGAVKRKTLVLLICAAFRMFAVAGITVWTASPMTRVTPSSVPERDALAKISLSLARHERESVQVLVSCDAGTHLQSVKLEILPLVADDGEKFNGVVKWERVGYVPRVSGAGKHPEAVAGQEKWLPDPLLPSGAFTVENGSTQGAWITVYAAANARSGMYCSRILIKQHGRIIAAVPFSVRVRNFSLSRKFSLDTAFSLMDGFLRLKYPDRWRTMKKQAIDIMLDHRLNPDDISRTSPPDIEDLLHARKRGMSRFNVLNIVPEPKGDVLWVCSASTNKVFSESFYLTFRNRLRPYLAELKKHGLDQMAYIYGFDECRSEYYPGIDVLWRRLKTDFPDLPMMTTTRLFQDFARGKTNSFDCVTTDWYCPVVSHYNLRAADRLRLCGKKVWWYVCNSPPYPYASIASLEYPPIEGRILLGCLTWLYRADGFLYWHVNNWRGRGHPLMNEKKCYFGDWELKNKMGMPGDGILLYPGTERILPSIRLANIRDGEEDYEYLMLAEEALGRQNVSALVRALVSTPMKFSRDASALSALRDRLADAIETAAER